MLEYEFFHFPVCHHFEVARDTIIIIIIYFYKAQNSIEI